MQYNAQLARCIPAAKSDNYSWTLQMVMQTFLAWAVQRKKP